MPMSSCACPIVHTTPLKIRRGGHFMPSFSPLPGRQRIRRSLFSRSGITLLSLLCCLIFVLAVRENAAFARATAPGQSAEAHFTPQMRLGFHAGDDWEPSITADRYGHVYALYKHYDVTGGQTCQGCDRHLLFQRSDDEGRTWNAPRPIAPGLVKGGQYDPQIVVDPNDGRTIWASFLQNASSVIAIVKSTD